MQRKVSCIVLAAGQGKRFGGDKLLAEIGGIPLIRYALNAIPKEAFCQTAVVSKDARILDLARQYDFLAVENPAPEEGISLSIRLGIEALESCDAILFMVADQPFLKQESILQMLEEAEKYPDCMIALSCKGESGNPVLFSAAYFEELKALQGDRGGKTVMRRYPLKQRLVEVPGRELLDIDTPDTVNSLLLNPKIT